MTRIVVGLLALAALAILSLAGAFAERLATDHARLHAVVALVALGVAGALTWRNPTARTGIRVLVAVLLVLAATQVLEAVGAFGFAANDDTRRNDLALAHDLGIVLSTLAFLGVVVGLVMAVGGAVASRASRRGL